jgi:MerR family gold-responsive transcriptional activator of gol and ges genes
VPSGALGGTKVNIEQVGRSSGLSARLSRYFESTGVLPKRQRTASGMRTYTATEVQLLRLINHAHELGFSLRQIRSLVHPWRMALSSIAGPERLDQAHTHLLGSRVVKMKAMRASRKDFVRSKGPLNSDAARIAMQQIKELEAKLAAVDIIAKEVVRAEGGHHDEAEFRVSHPGARGRSPGAEGSRRADAPCPQGPARGVRPAHKVVLDAVGSDEVCRRLMTLPGVGPVVVLAFKTAVDVPARFQRSRTVGAHVGPTPRPFQSGRDRPQWPDQQDRRGGGAGSPVRSGQRADDAGEPVVGPEGLGGAPDAAERGTKGMWASAVVGPSRLRRVPVAERLRPQPQRDTSPQRIQSCAQS